MISPIIFENEKFLIHPFRKDDFDRFDILVEDIYKILSDDEVLTFLSAKNIKNIDDAKNYMFAVVAGYHTQSFFTYFITIKEIKRTIGIINLLSPKHCKEKYILNEYNWMIEFYLYRAAWGRNIMSEILPYFKQRVLAQGIKKLGAACHPTNYASVKVLEKTGFVKKYKFDDIQDYYEAI